MTTPNVFERTFEVSNEYLQGYTIILDIRHYENIQQIENELKNKIWNFIVDNNLVNIRENIKIDCFHIHDVSFEHILVNDENNMHFWICSHCKNYN